VTQHPQRGRWPHGIRRFWHAPAAAGIAALLLASSGCNEAAQATKKTDGKEGLPVKVTHAERIELRRAVEAVGTLAAKDQAVISAEVAGRVARLAADMGDRVREGSPLVFLDAEKLKYRADEQQATLDQTRARLGARGKDLPAPEQTPDVLSAAARHAEAEQQLERARRLAARNLVSKEDLERAETQLQTAGAAHQAAIAAERQLRAEIAGREAALRGANRELQDAVIRAPFDGVVAERMVSQGQFVAVQAPVMRLVRLHPLRLTAEIPEKFGPGIHVGQVVSLRTDAFPDAAVEGRVTRISPDVNLKSRAFSIEADVPNESGALKPGTFARVTVATDRVDHALVVPFIAVQTRYGTSVVFTVHDDKLAATEVKLGDRMGPRVEILDGLEAGATIVAEGVEGLSAGTKVVVRSASDAKPAKADGARR
jgi:membrane fusion protein (multidrug efflux system)